MSQTAVIFTSYSPHYKTDRHEFLVWQLLIYFKNSFESSLKNRTEAGINIITEHISSCNNEFHLVKWYNIQLTAAQTGD